MTSEEHTHHFHSPFNSNCVVTLKRKDGVENNGTELAAITDLLTSTFEKFQVLESSSDALKVKFIDKDEAHGLEKLLGDKFPSLAEAWNVSFDYDALTHPGNIYVRGLTHDIDTQDLHQLFGPFGTIISCKIVTDEFGRSQGYGFVNFNNGASADEAIEKLNGLLVNGSKLYLNHHIAKNERLERIDYERLHFTNLYVKNLPESYNEDKLKTLFGDFGEVTSVLLPESKDKSSTQSPAQSPESSSASLPNSGTSGQSAKRFGFVGLKTHQAALKAIEALNGKEVEPGCEIFVSRAYSRDERRHASHSPPAMNVPAQHYLPMVHTPVVPMMQPMVQSPQQQSASLNSPTMATTFLPLPGPHQQQSNLYVKNLTPDIDDDALYSAFAPYGIIVSAKIMTAEDGSPRGFGFVCYKTVQEASRALVAMNDSVLDGQVIHVSFAQRNKRKPRGYNNAGTNGVINGGNGYRVNGYNNYQYYYQMPQGQNQFSYNQQYVPYANGGNRYNANGFKTKKYTQQQEQETQLSETKLNDHDLSIVELSAEVASAPSDDEKRAKVLEVLILPSLRKQGKSEEQGDAVLDKLLQQYQNGNGGSTDEKQDFWLDMINDWANEDKLLKQLNELSV